jgi:hypothetical protein
VALENIARRQNYPCIDRQGGCPQWFSIEHIAEHQAACVYRKIKCPFQITVKCSWEGIKRDFKEHAKAAHPKHFFESSGLRTQHFSDGLAILSCFSYLFTYCRQIKDGRLYGAVQLIGTRSEASKYKCEFTLRAANGIEQISNTFLVRSYTEQFEAIFNSGKCLLLDEKTARCFLKQNNLHLIIRPSTV